MKILTLAAILDTKAENIFHSLRRFTYKDWWRIERIQAFLVTRCAEIPLVSYGITIWGHRTQLVKLQLCTLQATCLRASLGAFRTTPNETLCVLAKVAPLYLQHSKTTRELKTNAPCDFLGEHIAWKTLDTRPVLLNTYTQDW